MNASEQKKQTAAQAGWRLSAYNLSAPLPDGDRTAVVNLMRGSCAAFSFAELAALTALDRLPEDAPLLRRLQQNGVLVRYDERAALESMSRAACTVSDTVSLTIAPTMACNFACPYCFETHHAGKMSADVQDAVVALAERMLTASRAKKLSVTWFGGEPLLATDVIEALSARLIAAAEEKGVKYRAGIITNGYLLTQPLVDMLAANRVRRMQITLDGVGAAHDKTRCLIGGGPSFDRIIGNLRDLRIPFRVAVRQNVHTGNREEVEPLRRLIASVAAQSGNTLQFHAVSVHASTGTDRNDGQVELLCGEADSALSLSRDAGEFRPGRGHFCGAQSLWFVGVDEVGRLYKCWEAIGIPSRSFGNASDWNPANPLTTAERPDLATAYLNTAGVLDDPECRACVWLPLCRGGCPNARLFGTRSCLPYQNDKKAFVLAVYRHSLEKQEEQAP